METSFEDLKGKTITSIEGLQKGSDRVEMKTSDGEEYVMYHCQSCCESVQIEDVCGDIEDILNSEILLAEEVTNSDEHPHGVKFEYEPESFTWTFYKISTIRGSVTIRWLGESNGCYSERVSFLKEPREG